MRDSGGSERERKRAYSIDEHDVSVDEKRLDSLVDDVRTRDQSTGGLEDVQLHSEAERAVGQEEGLGQIEDLRGRWMNSCFRNSYDFIVMLRVSIGCCR